MAKTALEEAGEDTDGMVDSVAKLREEVLSLSGVDIMEIDGETFKSTYQIVKELSKVWGNLNDISQANLLEMLGGKRGAVVLSAALQNFDIAEQTLVDSNTNAIGSMDRQLEVYNQSIQASLDRFHVAFQELSADVVNSDFIKGFVDFGTQVLNFLDTLIDNIGVLGTALAGLGIAKVLNTAITGIKSVEGLGSSLAIAFKDIISGATSSGDKIAALQLGIEELAKGAGGAGSALSGMFSSISPWLLGGAAVAGTAFIAYKAYQQYQENLYKQATETTNAWKDTKDEVSDYSSKYADLNKKLNDANISEAYRINIKQQLLDLQNEINAKYGDQLSSIDLVNGSLETQLGIISQISEESAKQNLRDNNEAYMQSVNQMRKERSYGVTIGENTQYTLSDENKVVVDSIMESAGFSKTGNVFKLTGDATSANEAIGSVIDNLIELKDETDSIMDKGIIQSAINSLQKQYNKNNEILNKYQENYTAYLEQSLFSQGFGDELVKYTELARLYNDALLGGDTDKIVSAREDFLEYSTVIQDITDDHKEFSEIFDTVTESIDVASEKLFDFKDIAEDGVGEANNQFKEYEDNINRILRNLSKKQFDRVQIQEILGGGSLKDIYPDEFKDLSFLADLFNVDLDNADSIKGLVDILEQLGYTYVGASDGAEVATESIDEFLLRVSNAIGVVEDVNGALANAFSSGGLSAAIDKETGALTGDVATIMAAYRDLDGYDPHTLFERTATGISVNVKALRELQSQQEETYRNELLEKRLELTSELAIANKGLENAKANDNSTQSWERQIATLESNIDKLDLLSAAYDGATSAYQKWLDAQNMGEAGDQYDKIVDSALKRGEELREAGLVGTNEFKAIAQLYSGEDLSTASIDEIVAAYDNGVDVVNRYFTEGQEGAVAFADKLVELGEATKDAQGNYDFSDGIDTKKIADDLGISVDLVEAAFKKLNDYGFEIDFVSPDQLGDMESAYTTLGQMADRINMINQLDDPDVMLTVEGDQQLEEMAEYLLSLPEEIKTEVGIETDDTASDVISKIQNQQIVVPVEYQTSNLNTPTVQSTDVEVNYKAGKMPQVQPQTVEINYTPDKIEVPATVNFDSSPIDNYNPKEKEVVFKVNKKNVDNYNPPNFNRNVNYNLKINNKSALDNLPSNNTTRHIYYQIHTSGSTPHLSNGTVSNTAFSGLKFGGNSHARGIALSHDENALINELGAEIVVRPSEDRWMIFNGGKPTMGVPLRKGDINLKMCPRIEICV